MDRVKGKVAIVTGSARGLGKAMAKLLGQEGARVVITDLIETEGQAVADEIRKAGGEAIFIKHDVTSESAWQAVIDQTLAAFGKLDVVVNNAGIMERVFIEDLSLESWRKITSVNLDGVFLGTKYAIRAMKGNRSGSIVNISSVAGFVGLAPGTSAYSATKGAVRIFSKAAAVECSKVGKDYHIRVNSVHPGFIYTEMLESIFQNEVKLTGKSYEEVRGAREDWAPLGHLGEPQDIANAVLYLASDESKYVTGTEIVIDGGFLAH